MLFWWVNSAVPKSLYLGNCRIELEAKVESHFFPA